MYWDDGVIYIDYCELIFPPLFTLPEQLYKVIIHTLLPMSVFTLYILLRSLEDR